MKLRFAPSPTGELHLGGLRTALFNYLLAKKHKGEMIIRIDDTDTSRCLPESTKNIISNLQWLNLMQNNEVFYQSKRLNIYQDAANHLVEKGRAYRCFCSKERLDELRIKQKESNKPTEYDGKCRSSTQTLGPHVIRLKATEGQDVVLLKSDNWPTYHLASCVDDHLMEITHVLRGQEWISSLQTHEQIYKMFNWKPPIFKHLPLLHDENGHKISKRNHSDLYTIESLKQKGYLAESLCNFCLLLSWSPKKILMTMDEMIQDINMDFLDSRAIVDLKRLDYIQKHHFERISQFFNPTQQELAKLLADKMDCTVSYAEQVLKLMSTRLSSVNQIEEKCRYFFYEPIFEPDANTQHCARSFLDNLEFNSVTEAVKNLDKKTIRYMVTGSRVGADLKKTLEILTKEVCEIRVRRYLSKFNL